MLKSIAVPEKPGKRMDEYDIYRLIGTGRKIDQVLED